MSCHRAGGKLAVAGTLRLLTVTAGPCGWPPCPNAVPSLCMRHLASYLVVLAVLLLAGQARSDCMTPPAALVWSYPADGAQDAPVNSKLLLLPPAESVSVNGVPATHLRGPVWDPGVLSPDSDYTVSVTIPPVAGSDDLGAVASLTFRTGFSTAASVSSDDAVFGDATPAAGDVYSCFVDTDSDCFDDCPNGTWAIPSSSQNVVLWQNNSRGAPWMPADCVDAPAVQFCVEQPGTYCDRLTGFGADGSVVESSPVCVEVACGDSPSVPCSLFPADAGIDAGDGSSDETAFERGPPASCSCNALFGLLMLPPVVRLRRRRWRWRLS